MDRIRMARLEDHRARNTQLPDALGRNLGRRNVQDPFWGTTQHRTARGWRCFIANSVMTWSSSRRRQKA